MNVENNVGNNGQARPADKVKSTHDLAEKIGEENFFDPHMSGTVPLTGRLEPWMRQLLEDPDQCTALIDTYDSPVNVLAPHILPRNAEELVDAGRDCGVDVRVYFARKANKGLSFVDIALASGHGIDVASERELQQVLARGASPDKVILSAAVKPDRLLKLAVESRVFISVDSLVELQRIEAIVRDGRFPNIPTAVYPAGETVEFGETRARVVLRIAPSHESLPPTRFGERAAIWGGELRRGVASGVEVHGVHLHLHGYSELDRRVALEEALVVADTARELKHPVEFVDIGGGVPMSYLDDADEWKRFQALLAEVRAGKRSPFTWKGDGLANTYPFWQEPTRADWLRKLLQGRLGGDSVDSKSTAGTSVAAALNSRQLRLHLEPGRSLLDGGGVILARVSFVKQRSDGVGLVGLEMNRTQCRTTSDDILVDPILVPAAARGDSEGPSDGDIPKKRENRGLTAFLVGAYCIEDEVIVRRAMCFPDGVEPGDVIAIPNTAGYFMHILESASHQIPLARNVYLDRDFGTRERPSSADVASSIDKFAGRAHSSEHSPESPGLRILPDEIDFSSFR